MVPMIQVTLDADQVKDLFAGDDPMRLLLEQVLNQILEEEMTEHLGAERYQRTDERRAYRNGYRSRRLTTRVGTMVLHVPQTRDGSFSTELFGRYQRSEQALVLALMEMVLHLDTEGQEDHRGALRNEFFEEHREPALPGARRACCSLERAPAWGLPLRDRRCPRGEGASSVRSTSALIALGINETTGKSWGFI